MTHAPDRNYGVLLKRPVFVLACLLACFAVPAQAAPAASPPNPPDWLETPPLPGALLARARGWAMVGGATAGGEGLAADILVLTGAWADLSANTLRTLRARPDGERRLLVALAGFYAPSDAPPDTDGLPLAMAAMAAGLDGIAFSAPHPFGPYPSAPAYGRIAGLVAALRQRNPDFLILLDLGPAPPAAPPAVDAPPADLALPSADGLIVHNVLTDAHGGLRSDQDAAARLAALKALLARNLPVLVAERSADPAIAALVKERLKALGAIPFVAE